MASTWALFPITWACSSDGFSLVPEIEIIFPAINTISKVRS